MVRFKSPKNASNGEHTLGGRRWPAFAVGIVVGACLASLGFNNPSLLAAGGHASAVAPSADSSSQVPRSSTSRCNITIDEGLFHSQSAEDKKLMEMFGGQLRGGRYIELGAFDGSKFSNSYVFNQALDWKGILVEAGPGNYQKVVMNRPNEIAKVNAAICQQRQTVHYYERAAVGGIVEFAPEDFKNHWWKGAKPQHMKEIQCLPMNELLAEHVGDAFYFDFLSLDVEGAEFEVLRTLDFTRYRFGIILVEADEFNRRKNIKIQNHLVKNGYAYQFNHERSDWFINDHFYSIYPDVTPPQ